MSDGIQAFMRMSSSERGAKYQFQPEFVWPQCVLDRHPLQVELDRLAIHTRYLAETKSKLPTNKEFRQQAEAIDNKAGDLMEALHNLTMGLGIYDMRLGRHQETAINHLKTNTPPAEFDLYVLGVDLYRIQPALIGLITHMRVLADEYSGKSSKSNDLQRYAAIHAIVFAAQAGIPLDRTGSADIKRIVRSLLSNIGLPELPDREISKIRSTAAQVMADQ